MDLPSTQTNTLKYTSARLTSLLSYFRLGGEEEQKSAGTKAYCVCGLHVTTFGLEYSVGLESNGLGNEVKTDLCPFSKISKLSKS